MEQKIADELKKYDVYDVKLPEMLFSNDCIYEDIAENHTENMRITSLSYHTDKLSGRVSIREFYSKEFIPSVDFYNTTIHSNVEELSVNGLKVFVIKQEEFCSITYQDNLTQYIMYLDANFADAVEIAKTISNTGVQ